MPSSSWDVFIYSSGDVTGTSAAGSFEDPRRQNRPSFPGGSSSPGAPELTLACKTYQVPGVGRLEKNTGLGT